MLNARLPVRVAAKDAHRIRDQVGISGGLLAVAKLSSVLQAYAS